jgi:hypothetical protein
VCALTKLPVAEFFVVVEKLDSVRPYTKIAKIIFFSRRKNQQLVISFIKQYKYFLL